MKNAKGSYIHRMMIHVGNHRLEHRYTSIECSVVLSHTRYTKASLLVIYEPDEHQSSERVAVSAG